MEIETTFVCAFCLHVNETTVDPTGGLRQEYVEDCQICCRPNLLVVTVDQEARTADITAVPS
jgi:hypothetical protein